MRYSRFKKQIDGTAAVRKPRNANPNSPRKAKADKNKPVKKEKGKQRRDSDGGGEGEGDGAGRIKEEVGVAGVGVNHNHTPVEGRTPSPSSSPSFQRFRHDVAFSGSGSGEDGHSHSHSPFVKREPGLASSNDSPSLYASTPTPLDGPETSTTPASSFNGGASPAPDHEGARVHQLDDMYASFGMPGGEYMMGQGEQFLAHGNTPHYALGLGMHLGMGDPYQGLWEPEPQQMESQQSQSQGEGEVLVKREPRWEPAYRQI
jgi:hypothetical protein